MTGTSIQSHVVWRYWLTRSSDIHAFAPSLVMASLDGRTLAIQASWEPGPPVLRCLDSNSGDQISTLVCAPTGAHQRTQTGFVVRDNGWRSKEDRVAEEIVELERRDDTMIETRTSASAADPQRARSDTPPGAIDIGGGLLHLDRFTGGLRLLTSAGERLDPLPGLASQVVADYSETTNRVRFVLGSHPVSVALDGSRPAPSMERLDQWSRDKFLNLPAAWHPTKDLVAMHRRRKCGVHDTSGARLCELPTDARPVLWLEDDVLVTIEATDAGHESTEPGWWIERHRLPTDG